MRPILLILVLAAMASASHARAQAIPGTPLLTVVQSARPERLGRLPKRTKSGTTILILTPDPKHPLASELEWNVDGHPVPRVAGGEAPGWPLRAGRHLIEATDKRGQSAYSRITVR